jgi:hypothetical protein
MYFHMSKGLSFMRDREEEEAMHLFSQEYTYVNT